MSNRWIALAVAAAMAGAGCSRGTDLEKVPVGSEVQLTREDGGVVEGKLAARDEETVKVNVGRTTKTVSKKDIADVRVVDPNEKPVALPPIAKFREYTIPAGTKVSVRLGEAVSSETSTPGDIVGATLADPVTVDGVQVLPAGSAVRGKVTAVQPAGKVKGRASLALAFDTVTARGETYPLDAKFSLVAPSTTNRDIDKVAIPAAGGAVIGAILGGGKGAAIGAAAGGGAGAAHVLMTKGKDVGLASGTELSVATTQPIDVKVPIEGKAQGQP
jgi:ribosome maturation factor RimP